MKQPENILSAVMGIEEDSITDNTSAGNVESWDSFNSLVLVTELENNYNLKFTMDEATSIKCVKDIKDLLRKYGVSFEK